MKEIFVYIVWDSDKFYITDREMYLPETYFPGCEGIDELVGRYDDETKLKEQLKLLFSAYEFHTSDSYTELIPLSVFKEFKNPADDVVKYLNECGLLG